MSPNYNRILNEIKDILTNIPYGKLSFKNMNFINHTVSNSLYSQLINELNELRNSNSFYNEEEEYSIISNRIQAINTVETQLYNYSSTLSFNYSDKSANRIINSLKQRLDDDDSKDNTHLILNRINNIFIKRREFMNNINQDRQNPIRRTYVEIICNPITEELYMTLSWGIMYNPDKILSTNHTTINNGTVIYKYTQKYDLLDMNDDDVTEYEPMLSKMKNKYETVIKKIVKKNKVNRVEIARQSYPDTYYMKDKYSRIYECDSNGVRFKVKHNTKYIRDTYGYYMCSNDNNEYTYLLNSVGNRVKYLSNSHMTSLFKSADFDMKMAFKVINYGAPFSIVKVIGKINDNGFIVNIDDNNSLKDKYFAIPTKVNDDEEYYFSKCIQPVPTAILYEAEVITAPSIQEQDEFINAIDNMVNEFNDEIDDDIMDDDSDTDTDEYTDDHYRNHNITVEEFKQSFR